MDTSGYVNPLVPLTIDELFDEIEQLPIGSDYIQRFVSFRDAERGSSENAAFAQELHYFMP